MAIILHSALLVTDVLEPKLQDSFVLLTQVLASL